jgi:hypothetical protein
MYSKMNKKILKLKKSLPIIALSLATILSVNSGKAQSFSGGDGSYNNPYQISTIADLNSLATAVNTGDGTSFNGRYFSLINSIDFNGATFTSIGYSYGTYNRFEGHFNGNGHTISNVNIVGYQNSSVGLFGHVGATGTYTGTDNYAIENLGLVKATISGNGYTKVGGIVGNLDGGDIKDCYVANSTISGYEYVGGIVGYCNSGHILYCYSQGNTISGDRVGGILGDYAGTVSNNILNCYSASTINVTRAIIDYDWNTTESIGGPIVGTNDNGTSQNPLISNSYYLSNTYTSGMTNDYGTSRNSTDLASAFASLGGDFIQDVFDVNATYPILKGEEIGNKDLTDGNNVVIPADYNGPIPDTVTIEDGAKFINNSNKPINAIVKSKLVVGSWNLFNSVLTTNTYGVLNSNYGETTGKEHDIASVSFNESINAWNTTYSYANGNIKAGEGIFVYPLAEEYPYVSNGQGGNLTLNDKYIIVEQKGTLFNSDFDTTATPDKWMALGNPYTTDMSVNKFVSDNESKLQGKVIYIYCPDETDDNTIGYWRTNLDKITINGSLITNPAEQVTAISPAHGFMTSIVNTGAKSSPKIKIAKDQLIISSAKENTNDNISLISFIAKANNKYKSAYININSESSNAFDNNDAYVMFSSDVAGLVEPYFIVDSKNLMKNEIKTLPYQCGINFRANEASNVDFYCENIPNDVEVSIVDTTTNEETSLNNANVFHFTANQGNNSDKYVVKIEKKNVGIENEANQEAISLSLYPNPAKESTTLTIDNLNDNAKVFLNDVQGRVINTYNVSKKQNTLKINTNNLTSGVYYIRVITNNSAKTEKLIVR